MVFQQTIFIVTDPGNVLQLTPALNRAQLKLGRKLLAYAPSCCLRRIEKLNLQDNVKVHNWSI